MFGDLKFPVVTNKTKQKYGKKSRKRFLKVKKAAKRRHCFLMSGTYTRCLECGHTEYMGRMGCNGCKSIQGLVEHGAYISHGNIKTVKKCRINEHEEFCTYKQIYKRLVAGERFFDWLNAKEITIKNFEG